MKHRFIGTRADLMQIIRPKLDPLHAARIAVGARAAKRSLYSPELRAEIIGSNETCEAIGRRTGVHPTTVSRIRRGEVWRDAAPTSSVFSLGASL